MSISPGPWGWVGTEGRQKRLTDATGREVVMGDGGRGFVLCSEGDARAIASVPTMVELLRTMVANAIPPNGGPVYVIPMEPGAMESLRGWLRSLGVETGEP